MGVHTEKATFTFYGVNWEVPFFKVIVGLFGRCERSGEEDQMARSSA